jgi:hypothetical protein
MARLRYNGLTTALGASLNTTDTTVTFDAALTHSGGVAVPTIGAGDHILLSIMDSNGRLYEIVQLTAYTSGATTGTISRAQEGTTAKSHASGATVVNSLVVSEANAFEAGGVTDPSWSGMFSTVGYGSGGTHTLTVPSGAASGDLIIVYGWRNDSGSIPAPSGSGWSLLVGGGGTSRNHVYYKTSDGTETTLTVSMNDYAAYIVMLVKRNSTAGLLVPVLLNSSGASAALQGCTLVVSVAGNYSTLPSATSTGQITSRGQASGGLGQAQAYTHDAPTDPTAAVTWSNATIAQTIGIKKI